MVLVPAGSFLMGSSKAEMDRLISDCTREQKVSQSICKGWYESEVPQHKVSIDSFLLDQYEVTNRLFAKFVESTGYRTTAEEGGWANVLVDMSWDSLDGATWKKPEGNVTVFASNRAEHPVVAVSWEDAYAYCDWAGKRLPTEAEFEYAMRAGTQTEYWWGGNSPGARKVANISDEFRNERVKKGSKQVWLIMDGYNDGYERTAPVGSFEPNPFHLYDMTGNVSEWTADWYGADYYESSPTSNPDGPLRNEAGDNEKRVVRGGSWGDRPVRVRSAYRGRNVPTERTDTLGFRCAQDIPK